MTEYHTTRVPRDLAGSGWYEILPAPEPAKVLDKSITADWIIVGGGFAGLAAARQLDQMVEGARIVVLDAQRIGWGAAGRNSGFMIDLPHDLQSEDYGSGIEKDKKQIGMNRAAIDFAKSLVEDYQLQCYWDASGKINAATDGAGMKALRSYAGHLDALDEPHRFQSAEEMQSITGIDYYTGGLFTPGCVQIQPAGYIRGLATGLESSRRNDVAIFEDTPVLKIHSGVTPSVITSSGSVTADKIILTVNGHLASFGFYQKQLMHFFTFASMTRQLEEGEQSNLGGAPAWGVTPAHPMGSTIRKLQQGRIVVRNTFTFNPDMQTSERQVDDLGGRHDRSFRQRFPMLPDVQMEYRWGGHLCLSLNSASVFGELDKNVFTACCQNGLGVAKGTLGGMLIAQLANGESNPMVDAMLSEDQPKTLPPQPFLSVGARAKLWWSQSRAGIDL